MGGNCKNDRTVSPKNPPWPNRVRGFFKNDRTVSAKNTPWPNRVGGNFNNDRTVSLKISPWPNRVRVNLKKDRTVSPKNTQWPNRVGGNWKSDRTVMDFFFNSDRTVSKSNAYFLTVIFGQIAPIIAPVFQGFKKKKSLLTEPRLPNRVINLQNRVI